MNRRRLLKLSVLSLALNFGLAEAQTCREEALAIQNVVPDFDEIGDPIRRPNLLEKLRENKPKMSRYVKKYKSTKDEECRYAVAIFQSALFGKDKQFTTTYLSACYVELANLEKRLLELARPITSIAIFEKDIDSFVKDGSAYATKFQQTQVLECSQQIPKLQTSIASFQTLKAKLAADQKEAREAQVSIASGSDYRSESPSELKESKQRISYKVESRSSGGVLTWYKDSVRIECIGGRYSGQSKSIYQSPGGTWAAANESRYPTMSEASIAFCSQ
jgi:hypothetical protein